MSADRQQRAERLVHDIVHRTDLHASDRNHRDSDEVVIPIYVLIEFASILVGDRQHRYAESFGLVAIGRLARAATMPKSAAALRAAGLLGPLVNRNMPLAPLIREEGPAPAGAPEQLFGQGRSGRGQQARRRPSDAQPARAPP